MILAKSIVFARQRAVQSWVTATARCVLAQRRAVQCRISVTSCCENCIGATGLWRFVQTAWRVVYYRVQSCASAMVYCVLAQLYD